MVFPLFAGVIFSGHFFTPPPVVRPTNHPPTLARQVERVPHAYTLRVQGSPDRQVRVGRSLQACNEGRARHLLTAAIELNVPSINLYEQATQELRTYRLNDGFVTSFKRGNFTNGIPPETVVGSLQGKGDIKFEQFISDLFSREGQITVTANGNQSTTSYNKCHRARSSV
ncbi:MAG: hypothetical protein SFU25_01905 [Candidatus Caenarcaniphilales bacterium]|nr:hypothetical protein [Candidatus Caenarcaniphilales bacterium]